MDIYLDFNATTPPDPAVVDAMLPFLRDRFGNAASSHVRGRAATAAVGAARGQVAGLLGVDARQVVWTSGATEALNTALKGLAEHRGARHRLTVGATEHKAVLDVAAWLAERRGVTVDILPVDDHGLVDLDAVREVVTADTFAVAVMAANNETGVVQPVAEVALLAREVGAAFVCDTTQVVGKMPVDLSEVDFVTVSAHKMYGPQGVGALVVPTGRQWPVDALLHGGGHERGYRSGTLNLPGIVGLGAAAELATCRMEEDVAHLARLRDRLEASLAVAAGPVTVHGQTAARLPNTTNVRLHGVDADALIVNTPQVAFSSGSACSTAVPTPSHVLTAMGIPDAVAEESVRLSVGRFTSDRDVDDAVAALAAAAGRIRGLSGAA